MKEYCLKQGEFRNQTDRKNRMGNTISRLKLTNASGHEFMLSHKMVSENAMWSKAEWPFIQFFTE